MALAIASLHALAVTRINAFDPTQTTTIRRAYEAEAVRRFTEVRRLIIRAVDTEDVFGLRNPDIKILASTPGKKAFDFPLETTKINKFNDWLEKTVDDEILDLRIEAAAEGISAANWQSKHIQRAYTKGAAVAKARAESMIPDAPIRTLESIINSPFNQDRMQSLFARNFQELKGITRAMDQQINRELSEGIAQGIGPRELARRLADRVNKIGITRARTLARTEIIRANAEATLTTFEQLEVQKVTIMAEFKTVGDDLVCVQCEGLEGEIFTVKEARGLIPQHPNCRCTWLPVTRVCKSPCVTGKHPDSARIDEPSNLPSSEPPLSAKFSERMEMLENPDRYEYDWDSEQQMAELDDALDEWDLATNTNFVDFERSWTDGFKDLFPSGAEIKTRMFHAGEGFGGAGELFNLTTRVVHNGKQLMTLTRLLDFDTGSAGMNVFRLAKEFTGRAIGKVALRNQQRLFAHIGLNKMILEANINVGGYAWAKYGYVPDQEDWDILRRTFSEIFVEGEIAKRFASPLNKLKQQAWKQLGNTAKELIDRIITNPDPKSIWMLADIQNRVKVPFRAFASVRAQGAALARAAEISTEAVAALRADLIAAPMKFGKRMLLGEGWHGGLDFSDVKAMKKFRAYISPVAKPLKQPLAIVAPPKVVRKPLVNPSFVDRAVANGADEFKIAAERANMDVQEFRRAVNKKMRQLNQEADLFVRVPEAVLRDGIIPEGAIKSQFETGASRGILANTERALAERELFGYSLNLPPEQRPIYGYLAPRKAGPFADIAGSVDAYGDIAIKMKRGVRTRTTMIMGDSFPGPLSTGQRARGAFAAPSRVNAPQFYSVEWSGVNARGGRDVLKFDDIGDFLGGAIGEDGLIMKTKSGLEIRPSDPFHRIGPGAEFTEAQIHRGLSLKDIDEVIFESIVEGEIGEQGVILRQQLIAELDREGIAWSVDGGGPAFKITPKPAPPSIFGIRNKAPDIVTWMESLPEGRANEVGRVFREWTEGSYAPMRAVERGQTSFRAAGDRFVSMSPSTITAAEADLKVMNEAFKKVKPFLEDSLEGVTNRPFADAWRTAASEIDLDGIEAAYSQGTVFSLDATASFSLDEHIALRFMEHQPTDVPSRIVYRLRTKSGLLIEDLAALTEERELLIKKGTRFRVTNSRLVNLDDFDDVMFVEAIEVDLAGPGEVVRPFSGPPDIIPPSRDLYTRPSFLPGDVDIDFDLPANAVPRTAANRITRAELASMDFEVVSDMSGGSNVVQMVILEDGTPAIWKPMRGESDSLRRWIDDNELYKFENAASQIAEMTGTDDLVMRSVIRSNDDGIGSLIEFVDGATSDSVLTARPETISLEDFTSELITSMGSKRADAERAAVFDLITGQLDRHGANWILKDGKMTLIDNALMMPGEVRSRFDGSTFVSRFKSTVGGPVNPAIVKQWDDVWDDLLVVFEEAGMSDSAIEGARQRLDMLLSPRLDWGDISETYLADSFGGSAVPGTVRNPSSRTSAIARARADLQARIAAQDAASQGFTIRDAAEAAAIAEEEALVVAAEAEIDIAAAAELADEALPTAIAQVEAAELLEAELAAEAAVAEKVAGDAAGDVNQVFGRGPADELARLQVIAKETEIVRAAAEKAADIASIEADRARTVLKGLERAIKRAEGGPKVPLAIADDLVGVLIPTEEDLIDLPVAAFEAEVATLADLDEAGGFLVGSAADDTGLEFWNKNVRLKPQTVFDKLFQDVPQAFLNNASSTMVILAEEGEILYIVEKAGPFGRVGFQIKRRINFLTGVADHESLIIPAGMRGQGVAAQFMKNQLELYSHWGIKRIELRANAQVGGYAWSKYGFKPRVTFLDEQFSPPKVTRPWDELKARLKRKIAGLVRKGMSSDSEGVIRAALDSDDPSAIWALSDLQEIVDGKKVGQRLLLKEFWEGEMNLSDAAATQRMLQYMTRSGQAFNPDPF